MKIGLVGLNHKTAPVEIREKVSIAAGEIPAALHSLRQLEGVVDCCILSTCNRFEVIFLLNEETGIQETFGHYLQSSRGIEPTLVEPYLYVYSGKDALVHLFRVASSLDSMILGEPQILGQVKEAVQIARKHGFLNTQLAGVFEKALFVAKRVRNETEVAASAVSISYAAVELARKIFGDLKGKKVLILGAGKMSELTAKHLMNSGIEGVVVSNRTYEKAVELAQRLNGHAARFDEIQAHLKCADIVIASTSAPHHVLSRNEIGVAIQERRHRPLFLIDIAVPRDVDPAANQLENVFLYNIDDLSQVVRMNLKMREKAAQQAEKIVQQEVGNFTRGLEIRSVGAEIADLRGTLEKICQEELNKAKSRMEPLSEAESHVLDLMVHRIVNKISHPLIMEMKRSPQESQSLGQRFANLFQRNAPSWSES